jgi:hypothetical protein
VKDDLRAERADLARIERAVSALRPRRTSRALARQRKAGGFAAAPAARAAALTDARVLATLAKHADARARLANVGAAVRELLARGADLSAIHAALLALARDGRIELRAERGDDAPDRDVLPPGPRGSYLATARILK